MGQYWTLFNLDKLQKVDFPGAAKLGEFMYKDLEVFMTNVLLSGQPGHDIWGGNRVILLGDYADDLPAACFTDTDNSILKKIAAAMKSDNDSESVDAYQILDESSSNIESVRKYTNKHPLGTVYALRNLDRKEYVRQDVVEGYRKYTVRSKPPGLVQALYTLVGWSDDPSAALMYNTEDFVPASGGTTVPLHQGSWAGNHIDIVAFTDEMKKMLEDEGWLDISEEKARHVSDVYACDGY